MISLTTRCTKCTVFLIHNIKQFFSSSIPLAHVCTLRAVLPKVLDFMAVTTSARIRSLGRGRVDTDAIPRVNITSKYNFIKCNFVQRTSARTLILLPRPVVNTVFATVVLFEAKYIVHSRENRS